jgi:hypothetical protein
VLACAAHDNEDQVVLRLLAGMLDPDLWDVEVLSTRTLGSELLAQTDAKQPHLICISALPPGSLAHTRYLCKRLRKRFPEVKILIARCGEDADNEENAEQLRQAGADFVSTTLAETGAWMNTWHRSLIENQPQEVLSV